MSFNYFYRLKLLSKYYAQLKKKSKNYKRTSTNENINYETYFSKAKMDLDDKVNRKNVRITVTLLT